MANIDAKTMEKLAKLLPMLSADHDGELIAASRAIMRTLKAARLDIYDLVASMAKPPRIIERPKVVYQDRVRIVYRDVIVEKVVEKIVYRDSPATAPAKAATNKKRGKVATAPDIRDFLGIYRESHNVINVAQTDLNEKEVGFMKDMRRQAFNKLPMSEKQYDWWKSIIERETVSA